MTEKLEGSKVARGEIYMPGDGNNRPQQPSESENRAGASLLRPPPRLVVDADGFCWRVYATHWSMCPVNPDNEPVPEPCTYYVPMDALQWSRENEMALQRQVENLKDRNEDLREQLEEIQRRIG